MDRVQWALHKQLKGSYDVARMTLSEQTEELSRAKAAREDIGVQLYQMQQQLAKLQMNLEKVHENHSIIAQMREAAEDDQRSRRHVVLDRERHLAVARVLVARVHGRFLPLGVQVAHVLEPREDDPAEHPDGREHAIEQQREEVGRRSA